MIIKIIIIFFAYLYNSLYDENSYAPQYANLV